MARPTSFRLSEELLVRLEQEAAASSGTSVSALVVSLLSEGVKTRRFPGIVYRDGPAGRRAGLVGGPDVWEIIRALKATPGRHEQRVKALASELGLPAHRIRLALDFCATFPDEIEARMATDERVARDLRRLTRERERLLST